ncbi:udp-glycosyltransferase 73c1 [Quercus suber]|uniref:Udp-glycosyltransferase 73c1 n=1 Tax=Quercus suber TaxID=58331 RepID=A0AAW0KJ24_QUESU
MASKPDHQLHFVLIPLMAPGHLIPMVDMARILAQRGVTITIVTTLLNAARLNMTIDRAIESGLPIQLLPLRFPCIEAGLPEGCENLDALPSREFSKNFFHAASMLQQPIEHCLKELQPQPSCMISDRYLPWTFDIAHKFQIPRLIFDGTSCFSVMCMHNIQISRIYERVSESESFVVPGLPHRIELTRAQLPPVFNPGSVLLKDQLQAIEDAELTAYGLIANTFEELEPEYIKECRKVKRGKVWCIGPVSLYNKNNLDKSERGNRVSIDSKQCLKWLDSWPVSSVLYSLLQSHTATMASKPDHQLHFVLIPLMAPGHLIPMVDMARILAQRGVTITIVTTLLNAARLNMTIDRAIESGLPIQLLPLRFPCIEAGLPEGCENLDALPSREFSKNFFHAASMLQQPIEHCLKELQPQPSCMISDRYLPWTFDIAHKFQIPRLIFDGTSCFSVMCMHNIQISRIYERVSESESFVVPGLPHRIELTRAQLPPVFNPGSVLLKDQLQAIEDAELTAYGLIANTFEELEPEYIKECRKVKRGKVWCIGPVSLYNKNNLDKSERGNRVSIDSKQCLKWLDSWPVSSVLYVCLGTLSCIKPQQLMELGLGLEASNRPFIWVMRKGINQMSSRNGFQKKDLEREQKEEAF